jgi:hypothetical protein
MWLEAELRDSQKASSLPAAAVRAVFMRVQGSDFATPTDQSFVTVTLARVTVTHHVTWRDWVRLKSSSTAIFNSQFDAEGVDLTQLTLMQDV